MNEEQKAKIIIKTLIALIIQSIKSLDNKSLTDFIKTEEKSSNWYDWIY